MSIFVLLSPVLAQSEHRRMSTLFVGLLLLSSLFATFSPTAHALTVDVGSGTLDYDKITGPRWKRVKFDPLISGDYIIRVTSDSSVDVRFSLFQTLDAPSPNNKQLIGTSTNVATRAEWAGTLNASERYYLGVSATSGSGSYTATIEAVGVENLLEVVSQPADVTVTEGEDATFAVTAIGTGALTYQWYENDLAITGATAETVSVVSTDINDNGNVFRVDITDDNGMLSSNSAVLEVLEIVGPVTVASIGHGIVDSEKIAGPRWVRHDFDSLAAANHTIRVSWDSTANVKFRVFEADGTLISRTIQGGSPTDWSGALEADSQYYIALWSGDGIANYNATIGAPVSLSIESQPVDRTVMQGDDVTLTVGAVGGGILNYQWFANGLPIVGETGDSVTIFAAALFDSGTVYHVEVSNGFETIASDFATLTVNESLILGLFSQETDTSAWMLDGPAPTLDPDAGINTNAWGEVLLRVGDVLLVGGDFTGIKPERSAVRTDRPFLAALDAVSGQPTTTFQVPVEVDSVVRALVLSPFGDQIFVGGDFGLLVLDATTGSLDFSVSVTKNNNIGRVFDIAVTDTQLYIGGDFRKVNNVFRGNIARLTLDGQLDASWTPKVTHGYSNGRAAPIQSIAVSPAEDVVYVGGNFQFVDDIAVAMTPQDSRVSLLPLSELDGSVLTERFIPDVDGVRKGLNAYDIVATEFYVIIAWGGPNIVSFHSPAGDLLQQYRAKGDVQALQVVGDHVFVGHHGEFFGSTNNPIPQEATTSNPFKIHSFRIDDPSFLPEQAWQISGTFGVWGIAADEDSIWVTGQIWRAGSNERLVDGLVRFPAL